jgi:ergothioneine biosynthesis protein EgtB
MMQLAELANRYALTRKRSEQLCGPLEVEDYIVQSMPDASPTRWHLAHTTWFFETFVLARWETDFRPFNAHFQVLFNSYYNRVGEQFPRSRRGLLTRPTVAEVFDYRHSVDERMDHLLKRLKGDDAAEAVGIVELGINHEQQHQELMLTDLKHLFSCNPIWPAYRSDANESASETVGNSEWSAFAEEVVQIGHNGDGFAFDNEGPRHKVLLLPFELQRRLVTAGEFLEFVKDGGYRRPELWLSLGWATVCEQKWQAPLYWLEQNGRWQHFTLGGLKPLNLAEPVCHVSYFEADAFARWAGARLSTEAEWEHAASGADPDGLAESQRFHPQPASDASAGLAQLYGEVWQWTASSYAPYPGYVPAAGALGEYNGKFMCNQYVLRGSSCATPAGHTRPTYRNFFPPDARWQFTGIRMARDLS